jgi:hypothetical protein
MYLAISVVGACICVAQIPVLISLFNLRQPGLLGNLAICTSWTVFFNFLQRTSSYFTAFIGVSRAIGLVCPAHMFFGHRVFGGLVVYTVLTLFVEAAAIKAKWMVPGFSKLDGFCTLRLNRDFYEIEGQAFQIIRAIDLYVVFSMTAVGLVISIKQVIILTAQNKLREFSRHASLTAILIAALHVVLTIPLLIDRTLDLTKQSTSMDTSPNFMRWHLKLFSQVVCTVVNAPINFLLLYLRTPQFKGWTIDNFEDQSERP